MRGRVHAGNILFFNPRVDTKKRAASLMAELSKPDEQDSIWPWAFAAMASFEGREKSEANAWYDSAAARHNPFSVADLHSFAERLVAEACADSVPDAVMAMTGIPDSVARAERARHAGRGTRAGTSKESGKDAKSARTATKKKPDYKDKGPASTVGKSKKTKRSKGKKATPDEPQSASFPSAVDIQLTRTELIPLTGADAATIGEGSASVVEYSSEYQLKLGKREEGATQEQAASLHMDMMLAFVDTLKREAPYKTDKDCKECLQYLMQFVGHESEDCVIVWQKHASAHHKAKKAGTQTQKRTDGPTSDQKVCPPPPSTSRCMV